MLRFARTARSAAALVFSVVGLSAAVAAAQEPAPSGVQRQFKVEAGKPIDPELAKLLERCGIDPRALSGGQAAPPSGAPRAAGPVKPAAATMTCNLGGATIKPAQPKPVEAQKPGEPRHL